MNAITKSQEIARTILQQIGGRQFLAMTGAKDLIVCNNGLAFSLPSYLSRNGINRVRIVLAADDTYTVSFAKVRGLNLQPISSHTGIYCDGLAAIFTAQTGLATRL